MKAKTAECSRFLKDIRSINRIPVSTHHKRISIPEYPFDLQLLHLSPVYRKSRKLYLSMGGVFSAKLCSTMRALSSHDLFKNEIEYTPCASEINWYSEKFEDVFDPDKEVEAIVRFSEISLFHEQNHRIVWDLLPPAPPERMDLTRYLNFAESLVVLLDLVLAEEIGPQLSPVFERMKVIYRTSSKKPTDDNLKYLLAFFCTTYFALEQVHDEDILNAVNYVLPGQKNVNKRAAFNALEINQLFTRVTNPLWQDRFYHHAIQSLKKIHRGSSENILYLPEDILDIGEELYIVRQVLDYFNINRA